MNQKTEVITQLLYKEDLYYTKGQSSVRKRKKVVLKEKKIGEDCCLYELAGVQFLPEELCFLETDELEFKVHRPVQHLCGTIQRQWQLKRFHTLLVLTYDIQMKTSSVQRFYEESSSVEGHFRKIAMLKRRLESILGSCFSWFVDTVEDVGEGFQTPDKLRLLLTSQNLCILDHKQQILHFHQLYRSNPNFTVNFDDDTKVLTMSFRQIWSDNFHTQMCIRVRTVLGEEIRCKINGMLAGTLRSTRHIISWIIDSLDDRSERDENESEEDISPPLPHLQDIHAALPLPCQSRIAVENDDRTQSDCIPKLIPPRRTNLLRAESMNDTYLLPRRKCVNHVYMNEEYRKAHSKSAHEDGSYNSIYYCNTGWIQCNRPVSPFRIDRHNRLSSEFGDVDLTAMKTHETWFDQSFKRRSFDKVYTRLEEHSTSLKEVWRPDNDCTLNIPVIAASPCDTGVQDDVYWNTDLCLCIHRAFENNLRKADLMETFDVTWEQLLALFIHLDVNTLHVHAKDWKDFAGLLELTLRDVEIIQHFCYTYREWPMFVLLSYWRMLASKSQQAQTTCCHTGLRCLLERLGRSDLLKILTTRNTNEHIQVAQESESTHF